MSSPLTEVFRTYYRRPVILLLTVLAVLLIIGMFFATSDVPNGNISIAPDFSLLGNRAYFYSSNPEDRTPQRPPEAIDTLYVHEYAEAVPIDLADYRNATSLELQVPNLSVERVQQIAAMGKLTLLELETETIPEETWQVLGSKLTMLEISGRLLRQHPNEVSQLTRLEILRLNRDALDEADLAVVAKIPNLRTLVLTREAVDTMDPDETPSALPPTWDPAALSPLKDHPHLQAIYVDWPFPTQRTVSELPGVTIYRAAISRTPMNTLMAGLFFSGVVSVLVVLQAWVHFSAQYSVIIPGYHRPHLKAAVIVVLGSSFLMGALLWLGQVAWLPAAALSLCVPSLVLSILVGTQSTSPLVRSFSTLAAMTTGVLIWLPLWLSYIYSHVAGELIWFITGELWGWAIGLFVFFGILLIISFVRLPSIAHQVYERTSIHPGFSPWDPQQQQRTTYSSKKWWMTMWDRQSFPSLASSSFWRRAALWRMGNAYRPSIMLGMMAFVLVAIFLGTGLMSERSIGVQPFVHAFGIQFGVMLLIMPLPIWFKRCRSLANESLRPITRPHLTRQLFAALALDQLWALPILVAGMGFSLYHLTEVFPFIPLAMIPLPLVFWIWFFSLGTSIFAIRRSWVVIAFIAVMGILTFAIPITVLVMLSIYEVPFAEVAQLGYLFDIGLLLAAGLVLVVTYQKALVRQWGL